MTSSPLCVASATAVVDVRENLRDNNDGIAILTRNGRILGSL
jgi:hypothetical protein